MQHDTRGHEVTSHGNLSVGLSPDISQSAYPRENNLLHPNDLNGLDDLPIGEDFGDVSDNVALTQKGRRLAELLKSGKSLTEAHEQIKRESGLPADCVPLISIEQLADALDDGHARRSWFLNKFLYEESRGADYTRTDEIVSSCSSLRAFLDLKTGYKAASAMNGGAL